MPAKPAAAAKNMEPRTPLEPPMLVASWSEIAPSGQAERDGGAHVVAADVTEGVDDGHHDRGDGEGDDAQVGRGGGGRLRDDRGVRSRPSVSV